jgi:hypothetical protein
LLSTFANWLKKINTTHLSFLLLIILNILIFLTSTASARFILADEVDPHLNNIKSAVYYLNSSSGRCTASLISNKGHFLTARHCLQRCLIPEGVFKLAEDSPHGSYYFNVNPEKLGRATCGVELNHRPETIIIEATSPGLIMKMDERSFQTLAPDLFLDLVDQGFTSEGDFVIFKTENYANTGSCLNLIEEKTLDQNHHVFSYPSETNRPDGFNSDGHNMYYSAGQLNPDIFANSCIRDATLTDFQINSLKQKFTFKSSFLSSVDAIFGSSGSSVVDENANVLGILINVYSYWSVTDKEEDKPENLYCEGSAKALRSSTILKHLKDQNYDLTKLKCSSDHSS